MSRWLLSLLLLSPTAVTAIEPTIELEPIRGLKADVATLILSGGEGGALRAAVLATPGPQVDGARRVAIWIAVEGAALLPEGSPGGLPGSIQAEVYVYAMTSSRELAGSLGYRVRLPVPELPESQLKVAMHLDLPPGTYQLHVLVREPRSQRFALRLAPLELASGTSDPGSDTDSGTLAREGAWLVDDHASSEPGLLGWDPLARVPGEDGDEESRLEAIQLSDRGRAASRIRAAACAYSSALDRLASGQLGQAVDRLRELEAEVGAHEEPTRASRWLEAAEDRVAQKLGGDDPESLLPLMLLHIEGLDRTTREEGADSLLTSLARRRIVGLAKAYGERAETDLAPTLAATALADVGVSFVRNRRDPIALSFLDSALALDRNNSEALFCRAFVHERNGRYEESVEALRRALALAPESHEGRLRLALTLRRTGRGDEAMRELRHLVAEASEAWILTIAYQELGRLLLAVEGAEAAARVLEEGLSRLPGQQRLHTQLSYLLDRTGERARGDEVIDEMPSDTGEPSPRSRYGEPQCATAGSRVLLLRQSTARFSVLAAALEPLREEVCR